MSGSDDLLEKIQRAKQEYYSENQKNLLFKNKQKFECASQIVQQIDPILVSSQVISFEENRIYFNYPLFKLVANPSLYMELTSRAFFVTAEILKSYSNYDIYINLLSITIQGLCSPGFIGRFEKRQQFFEISKSGIFPEPTFICGVWIQNNPAHFGSCNY